MTEIKTAIGLMSGTSMDGIDVALVKTDGEKFLERGPNGFFPYSPDVRKQLQQSLIDAQQIKQREERPGSLSSVDTMITELHAEAVEKFLAEQQVSNTNIDLIGFHGQTVLHRPETGLTVQLGDGEQLAKAAGIATVYDMRANDMKHGGQGAPLVPVYHQALAENLPDERAEEHPVVFVNIGGISNITYVGSELIAFDSGPGNALIDQWVQQNVGISHDQGGMIAAEGRIDQALVDSYMADPFFGKPVPKSLDRNDFQLPKVDKASVETVARSLARVTAEGIVRSLEHFPEKPALWIMCGGGRHNPFIMQDLQELVEESGGEVVSADAVGFDGDAMEAEAWAYLAVRSARGLPLTYPQTTGCDAPVTGGKIVSMKTL